MNYGVLLFILHMAKVEIDWHWLFFFLSDMYWIAVFISLFPFYFLFFMFGYWVSLMSFRGMGHEGSWDFQISHIDTLSFLWLQFT